MTMSVKEVDAETLAAREDRLEEERKVAEALMCLAEETIEEEQRLAAREYIEDQMSPFDEVIDEMKSISSSYDGCAKAMDEMAVGKEGLAMHEDKSQKLDFTLLDPAGLEFMIRALDYGAREKYGRDNYKCAGGGPYLEYLGSALRHIMAWKEGEDLDPKSGISHLGHAMCNLAFLSRWVLRGEGIDDRVRKTLGRCRS